MSAADSRTSVLSRLLSLWLLVLLGGCTDTGMPSTTETGQRAVTVYVVNHGWHTGLVIPASQPGALDFLSEHFANAVWYEIGWGDHEFYQTPDPGVLQLLQAGFVPTESVLHVVALPDSPDGHFRHARSVKLEISETGYTEMTRAIAGTFRRNGRDRLVVVNHQGLYGDSRFFAATGTFHALNNCNTWTADMLRKAGVPLGGGRILTADRLMKELERQ